jgi:translocation and assembly module TamB
VLTHIVLRDVTISDSLGGVLLQTPLLEASYRLVDLVAGRIVLSQLFLDRPVVHLVRLHRGRWNYEEVFRAPATTDFTRKPALVEFRRVSIRQGDIRVDAPTVARAPLQPVSRNGAPPNQPHIEQGPDGLVRVYHATAFTLNLPYVRIATPARDPILLRIAALAMQLEDPKLTLTDLQGEILTAGDSLRFSLVHADLPATRVRGGGAVRWPSDTILYDFALTADRVDLADLHWISPDFPDWQGRGKVVAKSRSGSHTDFALDSLTLGAGKASATGKLVAMVDIDRGLGMGGLDLALRDVPIGVLRPFLDTLPVAGTLTGRLRTDGYFDALRLGGDLVFTDSLVAGAPRSRFVIDGMIHFGGTAGAIFENFRLNESVVALGTVNQLVPSVIIPGDLRLLGRLDGPWENARFQGTVEHLAPNNALSRMVGSVRFDTRALVLGLALDADFDQLSFDALRSGYPTLTAQGGLTGHVVATGNLESLNLTADLSGEVGHIVATGRVTVMSPRYGADSLVLDLQRVDAAALMGRGTSTALNGRVNVTGTIDTLRPPSGRMTVALDQSRVGGVTLDAIVAGLRADAGMVIVDTAWILWPEGRIDIGGTIGYAAPNSGTLRIAGAASSLTVFDSLARSTLGIERDSLSPRALDGLVRAELTVRGALDDISIAGDLEAEDVVLDSWHVTAMAGHFSSDSLGAKGITLDVSIDTLSMGARVVDSIRVKASGRRDSLALAGDAKMHRARLAGGGSWLSRGDQSALQLDSLAFRFPTQQWQLARPVRIEISDRAMVLTDTISLQATDGSGALTLVGSVPGTEPGDLTASIVGLQLNDIFDLISTDSSLVSGLASLDVHLSGTRNEPVLRGSAGLAGPVFGEVRAPMVRAAFDYQSQRLRSRLTFWRSGDPILEVDLSLPYDLALARRSERKLDGPLEITARADSADLLVLEALTTSVRDVRGTMMLDLRASGTWAAPRLDGSMEMHQGRMTIPSLGVRYGPIEGAARFSGDSMIVDTLQLNSGEGTLNVTGSLRFAELTRPVMNLGFSATRFLVIDVPNFLRLRPSGTLRLQGGFAHPVLTGSGELTGSVIYFADLVTKQIVDLEDPLYADLVDTTAFRKQSLGAAFQSRFLDSLEIRNVQFVLGSEVWLRSSEANIQLEGDVTINKVRKAYRIDGDFDAQRGNYSLRIGPVIRDFTLERGKVRYLGTPDLNALLDLQARHIVHTMDGEELPIVAKIGGSILEPSLSLSSPGRVMAERDLVSYLMFGRSEFQQSAGGQATGVTQAVQAGVAMLSTALTSEVQRSLVNDFGIGIDLLELRPGFSNGGLTGVTSATQLTAGWQLGSKWFVAFNAGLCLGAQAGSISSRNFGASLEYRVTKFWRTQVIAAPAQSCLSGTTSTTQSLYKLGANLLWERDY